MLHVKVKGVMAVPKRTITITVGEFTDYVGDSLIVDQIMSALEDKSLKFDSDKLKAIRTILQMGAEENEKSKETN